MWRGPWATFPGIDCGLCSHGDYTFNSGPPSHSMYPPLRGKKQKEIKLKHFSESTLGTKAASSTAGCRGLPQLSHCTPHSSLIAPSSLEGHRRKCGIRRALWNMQRFFLLQFICNFLYYLISYAQMNNSKFLFLYQFVRTSVTNVCVCMSAWLWYVMISR